MHHLLPMALGLTEVDSMLSFDAHYNIDLMDSALKITTSALNLTDSF